jgi:acyl-CoA synthetase (AMP-forming)/AMP-acid ligase II
LGNVPRRNTVGGMVWPQLRATRWSDEQAARYYASGIWTRDGLPPLLAAQPPGKLAFDDGHEAVSYGELDARVRGVAAALRERGVREGAVVAVRMGNTVGHAVLAYAVAATGGVLFELPPDATPPQVEEALSRTRAVACFDALPEAVEPAELPAADPDAVGALMGTSGTTGTPKIAMRTTNSSLAMARSVLSRTGIGRDDVVLLAAPLSGGIGYFNGLCSAALTGCSLILPQRFEVDALLELLERHRVTALQTLPTLLTRMLAGREADTGALRVIQSGGAYLHPRTAAAVEDRFGCPVVSAYGATDVGVPAMVAAHGDTAAHRHETVGRPFDGVDLGIVDETGALLANGEIGEVVMRGPSTALGYYGDPDATRAVFDDAGWGHFGDLGRIDEDGYLRIVGRLKEVINRGGKKISVNAVEDHVRAFPGVADVAAVGYDDPDLGERCAVVVVAEIELSLDDLRAFLTERGVPKALWPERIVHMDELPVSPQGKVRRRELREAITDRSSA